MFIPFLIVFLRRKYDHVMVICVMGSSFVFIYVIFHRLWVINHLVLELNLWIKGGGGHYNKQTCLHV